MTSRPSTLAWNILAALLLTISVTLATDFVRRLLGADPDSLGIVAIAVQAVLALVASSTFTKAGSVWLDAALGRFDSYAKGKERWRCSMAIGLFVLTAAIWMGAPPVLTLWYNWGGFQARHLYGDTSLAQRDYQRAIALNPQFEPAYLNLGVLFEDSYQYDQAAEQYRKAIVADPTDATAYSDLAHVLNLEGQAMMALRIASDALDKKPAAASDQAALHSNMASAEYQLGFYAQGIQDANATKTAGGACILGKIYLKLNQPAEAKAAFDNFKTLLMIEERENPLLKFDPDCKLLSGEPL